jgi:tellurite resistance protein
VNPHFASLVLGLSQQAEAVLAGQLPPGAEGLGDSRQMAQTLIDTLGMLMDKTSGRLDPDEKQLLDQVVTSLRFRYVQTMPKS